MILEQILKDPFRNRESFHEWAKSFPLNEESANFICKLLERIADDLAAGEYYNSIINSKPVKENPKKFIKLLEKYDKNQKMSWVKGIILSKFKMSNFNDMKNESKFTKVAFLTDQLHQGNFNKDIVEGIKTLWKIQDKDIMPDLIRQLSYLQSKGKDFSKLFFDIKDEFLATELHNFSFREVTLDKIEILLTRAVDYDLISANEVWHYNYYNVDNSKLITDLLFQSLKKYKIYELKYLEWCIEEKVKINEQIIENVIDRLDEFNNYWNKRVIWRSLTKGNPNKTVEKSKKLLKRDDGTEKARIELGTFFDEIKKELYRSGNKDACIKFYVQLRDWLKGRDFITIPELKKENFESLSKNRIVEAIHEITEQLITLKTNFDEKSIIKVLEKYPKLNELIKDKTAEFLSKKRYNPILQVLSSASNSENRNFKWGVSILDKLEYYFLNFPKIKNGKYPNPNSIRTFMVHNMFRDFDTFLSEVFAFVNLHKAKVILECEPNIAGKNPEYLINLNGKKTIIEVKNYLTSEDLRLSGVGSDMEKKFREDFEAAFKQTVPKEYPEYPVVLVFDRSRSFVNEDIIHNAMHGSFSMSIPINNPEEKPYTFRAADSLYHKRELANYIQSIVIFTPTLNESDIVLKGSLIEHFFRKKLLDSKDLDCLKDILFT